MTRLRWHIRSTSQRRKISGDSIKVHSITGNRLKKNTLTGKQIKESSLGTVPKATTASKVSALKWHPITTFKNGWKNDGSPFLPAAYAIDAASAAGVDHLAFTLPKTVAPPKVQLQMPASSENS